MKGASVKRNVAHSSPSLLRMLPMVDLPWMKSPKEWRDGGTPLPQTQRQDRIIAPMPATSPVPEPVHRISPRPFLQFPARVARRFCHEVTVLQRLTGTRASTPSPRYPSTRSALCSALPPCLAPHSPSPCPRLGPSTPRLPRFTSFPSPTSCSPRCAVLPSIAPSTACALRLSVIASTPRSPFSVSPRTAPS